jgi:VWFA-related protein
MSRIAAAACAAALSASVAARAAAPPTVVTAEAEIVRVSVSVTDKQGRPVTDLKATDFVLTDEGQAQEITHFVPGSPAAMAQEPSAPAQATATDVPAAAAPAPARHVVLAIDDLHLSGPNLIRARSGLKAFVSSSLLPADEVAIATTSGAGVSRAFTTDRAAIMGAIDALAPNERRPNAGGRATMNQAQAEAIERGDQNALDLAVQEITEAAGLAGRTPPWAPGEAKAQARQIVAQALAVSNGALAFVEDVVRSMQPLPGRKLVVMVSDGFVLGPPSEPAAFDMRRLIDASARADVAVYPLLGRGVATEMDAAARGTAQGVLPGRNAMYARLQEMSMNQALDSIAEGTGGRFIRGTNDLASGLREILDDNATSYLIAYSPAQADTRARFHKIEVKVPGRPDLQVRARRGYLSRDPRAKDTPTETAEKRREHDIRSGLSALVPRRDVPVQMQADFVDRAPEGPQLVLSAHVDAKGVRFQRADGRYKAELEFVRVVADENGRIVAPADGKTAALDLTQATYEKTVEDGIGFQSVVPLPPGRYEVRMAVREGRTAQVGSARQWVEVPDTRGSGLTLSGVFLFASTAGKTDAAALKDVQATRRYAQNAALFYAVHAYNPSRDDTGAADVVSQAQVRKDGQLQGASPVETVAFESKETARPVRGRIDLAGMPAGHYELRVLVVDRKSGTQSERRIDFSIH